MPAFSTLGISSSALLAGRLRMDVISSNLANINTTRSQDGGPYQRRMVTLQEIPGRFASALAAAGGGVRVAGITPDPAPPRLKYDPGHPDADPQGFVRLPNVDVLTEMVDLMVASRAYEANVTAFNAGKAMFQRALEIGR